MEISLKSIALMEGFLKREYSETIQMFDNLSKKIKAQSLSSVVFIYENKVKNEKLYNCRFYKTGKKNEPDNTSLIYETQCGEKRHRIASAIAEFVDILDQNRLKNYRG